MAGRISAEASLEGDLSKAAEDARPLPVRTKPVLEVTCEEAEDYFNGMKSLEEVIPVMENRVRLYLNENS